MVKSDPLAEAPVDVPGAELSADADGLGLFPCREDIIGKDQVEGRIVVTLRPDCGEATAVEPWVASGWVPPSPPGLNRAGWIAKRRDARWAEAVDANTAKFRARDLRRAQSRARAVMRRFAVQNKLSRMWTLTFADEPEERTEVVRAMNEFTGRLRQELGERFPYLYVIEGGPLAEDKRFHVHMLLAPRYIAKERMQAVWSHGLVHFSDGKGGAEVGLRDRCRSGAQYLMKYVTKEWDSEAVAGQHRYERAAGFNVRVVKHRCDSLGEAFAWIVAEAKVGLEVTFWDSDEREDWDGPPCIWVGW